MTSAVTVILPPGGVNLIALPTEIEQHLAQRAGIGTQRRQIVSDTDPDRQSRVDQRPTAEMQHRLDHLAHIDFIDVQIDIAGLDLGKVEDLVDQFEKMAAGRVDVAGIFGDLFRRQRVTVAGKQIGKADDGIQRRAQFVAHVREERALGPVCGLGLLLGLDQRHLRLLARQAAASMSATAFKKVVSLDVLSWPWGR